MITKVRTKIDDLKSLLDLQNVPKNSYLMKQKLLLIAKSKKDKPKYSTKEGKFLSYYTTVSSKCYDENFTKQIKKLRPDWFLSLTFKNKQKLIELARKKADRPRTTCKLGLALNNYTRKNSKSYDPVFTKKIKNLRPDWLIISVLKNKQELIMRAKNGEDRPKIKTKLGLAFRNYTRFYSKSFDNSFYNQIKIIAPDWINTSPEYKKQEIIKIAKSGKEKPAVGTKLGAALRRYQFDTRCHDADFINKVKKLRPDWFSGERYSVFLDKQNILKTIKSMSEKPNRNTDIGKKINNYFYNNSLFSKKLKKLKPEWFVSRLETSAKKKKLILDIAKKGAKRPHSRSFLGQALTKFMKDPIFSKKIRTLRSDWFRKPICSTKKDLLIIAKSGKKRPHYKSYLGQALKRYVLESNNSYDSDFTARIKKIRPDWFRVSTALIKKELICLSKKGCKRPNHKTKLGMALCSYTCKSHGSYDDNFASKIKKLRPDWFRK